MQRAPESPSRQQHAQALLLALLCAVLFLREALVPGTALLPYPPEQFEAVRAERAAAGTLDAAAARAGNASGGDKYLQSLCWDRVLQDRLRAGESPRWTRDIGGGAPFVPQMAQVYEPINMLLLLLPSTQWYGWWFLVHQVLLGYLAWLFLRRVGCGQPAALVGLVAAALGLWTQGKLHHNVILTAAVSLWPMLTAVQALVAEGAHGPLRRRWVGWLALWTGLSWLSGFAVVSLQATYLVIGFALLRACQRPRGERLRALLPVGAGLALGGALSLAHMLPVLLASAASARASSYDPVFLAANGLEWSHALAGLWPDLLSWPRDAWYPDPAQPLRDVTRMPWSQLVLLDAPLHAVTKGAFQSWVETTYAIGTAPLALGALAFADRRQRAIAVYFAGAALLAFGFANADQPFLGLARFVPGLAAADLRRLLFLVAAGLTVLASLGAERLLAGARRWPALLVLALAALASAAGLAWLAAHDDAETFVRGIAELYVASRPEVGIDAAVAFVQSRAAPGEWQHNFAQLGATGWRTLLAALVAIAAMLLVQARLRSTILLGATMLELLHAGAGFFVALPARVVTTPPAAVAPALAAAAPNGVRPRFQRLVAPGDARGGAVYPPNLAGFHGIEDAAGYNPLPPARYEEFFTALEPDREGKANVAFGGAGVGGFRDPASLTHPLADLYGIRFVLTDQPVPASRTLVDRTPPNTGAYRLYERTTALPRATFVHEVDVLPDRVARLAALADRDRDVARRTVLEDPDAPRPAPGGATATANAAAVEIISHRDEEVVVRVATGRDGYLRLHDPFDPGWTATIDGERTTVFAADHYLRAVHVPPGDHEVVFRYDAARVLWPERLSLLALAAILLLLRTPTTRPR